MPTLDYHALLVGRKSQFPLRKHNVFIMLFVSVSFFCSVSGSENCAQFRNSYTLSHQCTPVEPPFCLPSAGSYFVPPKLPLIFYTILFHGSVFNANVAPVLCRIIFPLTRGINDRLWVLKLYKKDSNWPPWTCELFTQWGYAVMHDCFKMCLWWSKCCGTHRKSRT